MFNKGNNFVILDDNFTDIKKQYKNKVIQDTIVMLSSIENNCLKIFQLYKNRYYFNKTKLPSYRKIQLMSLKKQQWYFKIIIENNLLSFNGRLLPDFSLLDKDFDSLLNELIKGKQSNKQFILSYLVELNNHKKILFPFILDTYTYIKRRMVLLRTDTEYNNNFSHLIDRICDTPPKNKKELLTMHSWFKNKVIPHQLNSFQNYSTVNYGQKLFNKDFYSFNLGKYKNLESLILESFNELHTSPSKYKQAIQIFLAYINTLDNFDINNFNRLDHIFDPRNKNYTLLKYLKDNNKQDNLINLVINNLFKFCAFLVKKEIISNNIIIPREDSIPIKNKRTGTHRKSLNDEIIQLAKKILIQNNFEFVKTNYSKDIISKINNHITNEVDSDVFSPSTTIALYTLLEIPLRGIQVQFLDSGENDEFRYSFEEDRMIFNKKTKRNEGLIRKQNYESFEGEFYSLWITTNKSITEGYEIPYLSDDYLAVLKYQYDFLAKYDPNPNFYDFRDVKRVGKAKELKKYNVLFRDLTGKNKKPISKKKIGELWALVCLEIERVYNKKGIKLKLTKSLNNRIVSKYDIHSLRVSGITNLLDKGVPLNIVSKYIAGHSSYLMTLWYNNPHPSKVREALEEAKSKINQLEFDDSLMDDFIGNTDYLIENKGMLNIGISGICPFKNCEIGGSRIGNSDKWNPVPMGDGKPNCFECRFFITGPKFLAGQVLEGNILIKKIQDLTIKIDELKDKVMDYEDEGKDTNIIKGELRTCELRYSGMVSEWWSRMKVFEKSKAMDSGSLIGFDPSVKEVGKFELLHSISTYTEVFPELQTKENMMEIENLLSRFLMKNNIKPFIFELKDDEKIKACNILGDLILELVDNSQVDKLINGDLTLKDVPLLEDKLNKILGGNNEIKRLL